MTSRTALSGVFSPVLTPFSADFKPHIPRYVEHCRKLLSQDVGLAIFGTNSEANSLSMAEKRQLLDALLENGLPADRMMPGTGACSVPETIEMTRHAVASGCAGVLMLPPFYYKGVSDEGLFRHFAQVVEGVGDERLRLYLYHIPPVSQVGISHALIERLLKQYPGIVAGLKDSGGDWSNTASLIRHFQPEGFQVFAGTETVLLDTLKAGGAGCITATANVNPTEIMRLYRSWQAPEAPAQQARINQTRAVFQAFPMIPAMKAAIAWQTDTPEWRTVRPPLVELTDEQAQQLRANLEQQENATP
ncbi:dihydrodipicolinate synthase family protein [Pusillimonas sp. SM2304]|uniref:dihydrodipicolinate synthase family protein n=1 Tax=Pusillimonas sp. SM2304 TaxID=3073241 RepID=UPI002876FED3|nr:dihydrodipicolinate synthase family protein [Pusillimonas sp. SM2304]MDS1141025.1 dihydrodipicolinate synthase family protein [Pusillimonas sp. SM2304]